LSAEERVRLLDTLQGNYRKASQAVTTYVQWMTRKIESCSCTVKSKTWITNWAILLSFHLNTMFRFYVSNHSVFHLSLAQLDARWNSSYLRNLTDHKEATSPMNFRISLKLLLFSCHVCGNLDGCYEFCSKGHCNEKNRPKAVATPTTGGKADGKGDGKGDAGLTLGMKVTDYFAKNQDKIMTFRTVPLHGSGF
jgi:hypothetical protein